MFFEKFSLVKLEILYIFMIYLYFQLAKEIRISPSQSPIALATHDVPIGQQAIISGWGRVHPFSWLSRDLQKLSVPIIDNNVCQAYYQNITILSSQICTFERKGIGACKVKYITNTFYKNILLLLHIETYTKLNSLQDPNYN